MDILQLQYFLKLANHQHVSKTADLLHISQPSLSATIKKLENELGVKLFLRQGRNIVLSNYGEVFKDYVEKAFSALENGKQAIYQMQSLDNNTLNLGMIVPYVWNDVFRKFHSIYPHIHINIHSMEGHNYFDSIISKEIDLYLGGINQTDEFDTSKFEYKTLYEDDVVLLVNQSHPLAERKEISLSECSKEKFINLKQSSNLQQFINILYEKAGINPYIAMTCDYTLRDQMVSENCGIIITTMHSALQCNLPNVKYLKITHPTDKRKLGLVWRRGKKFTPTMQKFYDIINDLYSY